MTENTSKIEETPDVDAAEAEDNSVLSEWITLADLAKELNVATCTLGRWHTMRTGPPRAKVGGRVLYRRQSVREWLRTQEGDGPLT